MDYKIKSEDAFIDKSKNKMLVAIMAALKNQLGKSECASDLFRCIVRVSLHSTYAALRELSTQEQVELLCKTFLEELYGYEDFLKQDAKK